jgi:hypothetical protein
MFVTAKSQESDRNSIQSAVIILLFFFSNYVQVNDKMTQCCDENRGKITQLESDLSRLRLDYEYQVSRNTDISAVS